MADRTIRVNLVGSSTSLVQAANQARNALNGLARVNLGAVRGGIAGTGNAAQQAAGQTSGWANALKTGLSVVGIQAGFRAITQGFGALITAGLAYQGNMNTLSAVTGATDAQMARLGNRAKQLGDDIRIPGASAATATEAMKELAKGGLAMNQAMVAARGTLMLAAAAQISGGQAAQIQAKALNAFRLEADQANHVADVLANAANAATGEITDMAQALQQSATVAQGFGISIDDATVTLALFAKNGVIGSDAGTSFKTMLTQLASPTKNQRSAMQDLNLEVYNAQGKFMGMESITKQLSDAYAVMTTEQYNTAASTLFGTDAIRAANILGVEGVFGWNQMTTAVTKAGGAEELAAAQTVGLNGALDVMSNVTSTAALSLFESLQPAMVKVVHTATDVASAIGIVVNGFFGLPTVIRAPILGLTALVLLRGPLMKLGDAILLSMTKAAFAMAAVTVQTRIAGGAMAVFATRARAMGVALKAAFMDNPIGLILVGITTLVAAFGFASSDAADATIDLGDAIDENTGKLKSNADEIIRNASAQQLYDYQRLGGEAGSWTSALMGNAEAQDKVHTAIQAAAVAAAKSSNAFADYKAITGDTTMTIDQFATAILAGKDITYQHSDAMDRAIEINRQYQGAEESLGITEQNSIAIAKERAAQDAMNERSGNKLYATYDEMEKAIASVDDAMGFNMQRIKFKNDIDTQRTAIEQADLAAQSLTISLLLMHGDNVTAAQAARANAAAMRMMATSARQHESALADVASKQQDLNDLQDHGTSSPADIAQRQKALDDAAAGVIDAQKAADRSASDAAQAAVDNQESRDRSAIQVARQQRDTQKALAKAQSDAARDEASAREKLAADRADPKATAADRAAAQTALDEAIANGIERVASAQEAAADAALAAADLEKNNARQISDAARSAADSQESAQQRVLDANSSVTDAQVALQEAQDKSIPTAEQLAEANRSVADAHDAAASAADAQLNAVDAAAQSAIDMAAAAYAAQTDLAAGTEAATAEMQKQREKFIEIQMQINGGNRPAAEALADEHGLIAEDVHTIFSQAGIDGAIAKAQAYADALNAIPGVKTITFVAVNGQVYQETGWVNAAGVPVPRPAPYAEPRLERNGANPTELTGEAAGIFAKGYAPGDLHATGGIIAIGTTGTADDVNIRASKGEFVVNAAQTTKHRSLLEAINAGTNGYRNGGLVNESGGFTDFGVLLQGRVALPDAESIKTAWLQIATATSDAWTRVIAPTMEALTIGNLEAGASVFGLDMQTVQSWLNIGAASEIVVEQQIAPTYRLLMYGNELVGKSMMALYQQYTVPAWYGIAASISAAWTMVIQPTFTAMAGGMVALGVGYTGVSAIFTGMAFGMAAAKAMVIADLTIITKAIDDFFIMVDGKAPVAITAGTVTVPLATGVAATPLADGGLITAGTGPRSDDVHIRASKGEYVVNAKSTAAHRGTLDRINYGGAYADGGLIGEKIGNRLENAIVGGMERAVEAGVTRIMASVPAAGGGDYLPVNIGNVEGARGRFLNAVASQMGLEYVWGGASPPNFDCSGLMSWGLSTAGVGRGRLTAANFSDGFPNFSNGEKPGDMAIFDTGRVSPKAGHIGAVMDPAAGTMMHTDGDGPSRVSDYRNRSGLMGFVDPIGGAYVPAMPTLPAGTRPGDPPSGGWLAGILSQIARGGTGGVAGNGLLVSSDPGMWGSTRLQDTTTPTTLHSAMSMSRGTPENVGPVPPGGAVERWRPMYLHALGMLGKDPAGIDKMMYQMFRESSGNPLSYAIDSNYYAGKPSKGLLQTIPSTFTGNASAGYNTNIWDPLSNALASLNYIKDPMKYPGGAYDNGGLLPPGMSTVYNGLSTPEMVMTDRQWAIASASMNHVVQSSTGAGGPMNIVVTLQGGDALSQQIAHVSSVTINGVLYDGASEVRTMAMTA